MDPEQSAPITGPGFRRALWFAVGGLVLMWIGIEDRSTAFPLLIAGLIALGIALRITPIIHAISPGADNRDLQAAGISGLITGTLVMPLAALAMLIKVSLHGHVPPDFSLAQIREVLLRTPIWSAAGLLTGVAISLLGK